MAKQQPQDVVNDKIPLFSFIIPTFNRPLALSRALQSISKLKFENVMIEIIVIDDGSAHPMDDVIQKHIDRIPIIYRVQKNQGPARARNLGAELSQGKYLVFLDDDCSVSPEWLSQVMNRVGPDHVTGGKTINRISDNVYSQASQELIDYLYTFYNKEYLNSSFITSNNMIIPKSIFCALHGFDTDFTDAAAEDRDFCDRLKSDGYEIIYVPDIIIYHWHRMNFTNYLTQHYKYGYQAKLYHEKRSIRNNARFKVEPLSFYINLLFFPFKKHPFLLAFRISLLFVISQIANTSGFFWAKINK